MIYRRCETCGQGHMPPGKVDHSHPINGVRIETCPDCHGVGFVPIADAQERIRATLFELCDQTCYEDWPFHAEAEAIMAALGDGR